MNWQTSISQMLHINPYTPQTRRTALHHNQLLASLQRQPPVGSPSKHYTINRPHLIPTSHVKDGLPVIVYASRSYL